MRYGIFSDVHGNLEALIKAADFYKSEGIKKLIFIGDAVGYGANPVEAIGLIKKVSPVVLAGNHDWAVAGKFRLDYFNDFAAKALVWTKKKLKRDDIDFLSGLELLYKEKHFVCTHGSLINPEDFNYILTPQEILDNFKLFKEKILFIGHTHRKAVYVYKKGVINSLTSDKILLDRFSRYIVNVGSLGQPRDKDNRACLCIYDDEKNVVEFIRLDYDIKSAGDKILQAGLPKFLADRLYEGR